MRRLLRFAGLALAGGLACSSPENHREPAARALPHAGGEEETSASPPAEPAPDASKPPGDLGPGGDFRTYAERVAARLQGYYGTNGLFTTTGWWNSANALTALIDYAEKSGSTATLSNVATTFDEHSSGGFLNEFYDDEGWWALAWIRAFDVTKDARYLAMAKSIFQDMVGAWDATCGGGIWWTKERKYKNAISNELFLEIAARLHERTPGDAGPGSFIDWADRTWRWFDASGMINASSLVNDGLDASCKNNGQTTWTYNQGVLMGALVILSRIKNQPALLARAEAIADATRTRLSDPVGVLREPCEPDCGADGPQFKGIYMRHLAELAKATKRSEDRAYLATNADWIWNAARSDDDRIGLSWSKRFDSGDAARQCAALDALNAAIPLSDPQVDLARARPATASAACSGSEGAEQAVDGDAKTKWCSGETSTGYWLEIELASSVSVGRVVVRHAGAGGEDPTWNTRDFTLRLGDAAGTFTDVAKVSANTRSVTIHRFTPRTAKKIRLEIAAPQTGPDAVAARIYALEVFGR